MPQFDFGVIQAATTTGSDLATILEQWRDAVNSSHLGSTRPPYVKQGQIWVQSVSGTNWLVNLFDGVNDIALGTVNPANDTSSFSGRSLITTSNGSAGVTLSQNGMTVGVTGNAGTNLIYNLPAAAATGNGFRITFQKRDNTTGTITLSALTQDNINGATTYVIYQQYDSVTLISDGANSWYALGAASVADLGITTAKLADGAVTTAKLADGAVTAAKFGVAGSAGSVLLHDGTQWSGWFSTVSGLVLRSQGTAGPAQWSNQIQRTTPYAMSAQANSFSLAGFASSIRRLSIVFSGITMSVGSPILVSIGSATGGIPTTGYIASGTRISSATASSADSTAGFIIPVSTTITDSTNGVLTLSRNDTLQTIATYTGRCGASSSVIGGGVVTLTDVMDRINIRTLNGTSAWTAGTVTFLWE